MVYFNFDDVTKTYIPSTVDKSAKGSTDWSQVPEGIRPDVMALNSLLYSKYEVEYLILCAFYNKMFPSFKSEDWYRSSYNTVPFTLQYQEHTDTGTGITSNYLKTIIDSIVSRLGNTKFDFKILADQPTLLYAIYKDEIERIFKSVTKKFNLTEVTRSVFHDASILCFSHVFVDPYTHELRKVNDYELGVYECEFNTNKITRALITNYCLPVSALGPYVKSFSEDELKTIIGTKTQVTLAIYIDCMRHKSFAIIEDTHCSAGEEYPFDEVLMTTYSWDIGVSRSRVTSLFSLLYPIQRQLDQLLEKKGVLLRNYKGPVPIFNQNCDIVVKELSNATGEFLFLDNSIAAQPSDIMTVLEPTPLDANLNAEMDSLKGQMFEIAGIQNISMDLENYRSASALLALEQQRDASFQSQVASLAEFVQHTMEMYITFCAKMGADMPGQISTISWQDIDDLLHEAYLKVLPVHDNDPMGGAEEEPADLDYMAINVDKFVKQVIVGKQSLATLDFTLDYHEVKKVAATKLMRLKAITDGDSQEEVNLTTFLVQCFVEDVKRGEVTLS